MSYKVLLLPRAKKDLDSFKGKIFTRLSGAIGKLAQKPRPAGSRKLTDDDGYRIRISAFRILYRIDDAGKRVLVYRVRHRREAYR